jgi:hypothetical protein
MLMKALDHMKNNLTAAEAAAGEPLERVATGEGE